MRMESTLFYFPPNIIKKKKTKNPKQSDPKPLSVSLSLLRFDPLSKSAREAKSCKANCFELAK